MGRVNATPLVRTAGGRGSSVARRTSSTAAANARAASARLGRGLGLLALGTIVWFAASTIAELGDPANTISGSLFLLTVGATSILGGLFVRNGAQALALAAGSVVGLVLSGLLGSIEPSGRPLDAIASVATDTTILVLVGTWIARSIVTRLT